MELASMILIGLGCFLSLVGGLGLFRLPDF